MAMIQGGVVTNISYWDGTSAWNPADYTLVDITSQPTVSINWTYNGTTFSAPSATPSTIVNVGGVATIPVLSIDTNSGTVATIGSSPVDKLYDHWHGTTQYNSSQLRKYTNLLTTDSNGRVIANLTQNGNVGGTALFTSLLYYSAAGIDSSGTVTNAPFFIAETVSSTQIIFRGIKGNTTLVSLLGTNVTSSQYIGSGMTVAIKVTGVK